MLGRPIDLDRDLAHVHRILREVGWQTDANAAAHEAWLRSAHVLVADLDGEAECFTSSFGGHLRHLDAEVRLTVVGGVATSRVGRMKGLATGLTARAVSEGVERGAVVAGLGVFDHGFYERLGFAPSARILKVGFDPAHLRVPLCRRTPVRLGTDDFERMHAARLARRPHHGAVSLGIEQARFTHGDVLYTPNGFGLGFEDGGELTHLLWLSSTSPDHGPYTVTWMAWRDREQLWELLGLLKALADQVHLVIVKEPPGVRLDELVDRPFRTRTARKGSAFAPTTEGWSYQQLRICDLPGTLRSTRLPGPSSVTFRLDLADPIARWLDEGWRGTEGSWVVTLGPQCHAEPATAAAAGLPAMRTSVGTFTQLWLGVARPTDLPLTRDDLHADPGLLQALDDAVRLPAPAHDWDF